MFKRLSSLTVLLQFLPLSFFSSYGFWQEQTSNVRWLEAFQIAALLAILQLSYFFYRKIPLSRLILSANIYLILGGAAVVLQQWWYLTLYGELQETAIFIIMLFVALFTMGFSHRGFIGVNHQNTALIRKYSFLLLVAVLLALCISIFFQGKIVISTVLPLISLAIAQRYLAFKMMKAEFSDNDKSHQNVAVIS